jgi:outer membrane protein insertion porin family
VIDTNIAILENYALRQGLNFVRVEPRLTRNDRTQTLDVTFAITRGPRVFVERIDIEGNTTTLDEVIRRKFRTAEGDPFNPREIRQAAARIRALGYFEDAKVDTQEGSSPDQVVVNVDVVEQPTGSLSLGAAYSVSDGVSLTVGIKETNFLGRGQTVGLNISGGKDNLVAAGTFTEPAFLDRDLSFTTALFYRDTQNFNADYNTNNAGALVSLGFPVGLYSRLDVRYGLSDTAITDVSPESSAILQREEARGSLSNSEIGYTYVYDTRTEGLDPLGGVLLRFGQDFSGLGGDTTFITTNALASIERKILNEEVVLRATVEGSAITNIDVGTTVVERFFGNGKLRGFKTNGFGPRDLTAENQDALGGNLFGVLRLETEFPLGTPTEYGLRGGLFLDTGSVWSLVDTAGTGGPVDDSLHIRSVIGFSLFWDTPVGPLRFNFTKALVKEDYDEVQNFDLSVSTTF